MDSVSLIATVSMIAASLTVLIGSFVPAYGEARCAQIALQGIAQQPDAASKITSALFVSMAMVESTAIYCFVTTMILLFANPFWSHVISVAA